MIECEEGDVPRGIRLFLKDIFYPSSATDSEDNVNDLAKQLLGAIIEKVDQENPVVVNRLFNL